ncbi:hypothetical protein MMC25_002422 [Agyrium rufum]|nr:hypothetical protein [Agyrium rufum]
MARHQSKSKERKQLQDANSQTSLSPFKHSTLPSSSRGASISRSEEDSSTMDSASSAPSDFSLDMSAMGGFDETDLLPFDGTSPGTSPSPNMIFPNVQFVDYNFPQTQPMPFQKYEFQQPIPIVEFEDLTNPHFEDRRKRRSSAARDKQTLSSMHMRRRAQNRASQRAFRERKERHAQELQQQLDELESKHSDLMCNYKKLDQHNAEMADELQALRDKLAAVQTLETPEGSTFDLAEMETLFDGVDLQFGDILGGKSGVNGGMTAAGCSKDDARSEGEARSPAFSSGSPDAR